MTSAILGFLGNLAQGLAAALPYLLAYLAGGRGARLERAERSLRRRHAQLEIARPSGRAVLDSLRGGTF